MQSPVEHHVRRVQDEIKAQIADARRRADQAHVLGREAKLIERTIVRARELAQNPRANVDTELPLFSEDGHHVLLQVAGGEAVCEVADFRNRPLARYSVDTEQYDNIEAAFVRLVADAIDDLTAQQQRLLSQLDALPATAAMTPAPAPPVPASIR